MGNSKLTNCPVCGTPCTVEGHTTHQYKPVEKKGMDRGSVGQALEPPLIHIRESSDTTEWAIECLKNQTIEAICQTFRPAVDVEEKSKCKSCGYEFNLKESKEAGFNVDNCDGYCFQCACDKGLEHNPYE